MSLHGTLGDFGIADIFQLIGHQTKTGVLVLKDREIVVRIFFVEGNVVTAEQSVRDQADLLGNLMVRAGVLTEAQLAAGLAAQQRTFRRLEDVLVDVGAVSREVLKEFARLQTTETIYSLFQWRAGTYEFNAQPVEYDEASCEPIRSENILMEGFRMVDEWPAVRRVVPSSLCTFQVVRDLPAMQRVASGAADDDIMAGMRAAFGESEPPSVLAHKTVGAAERQVFAYVKPGVTVLQMVDRSRLGAFETTKALATLVTNGHLEVKHPESAAVSKPKITPRQVVGAVVPFTVRVLVFALVAVVVGVLVRLGSSVEGGLFVTAMPRAEKAAVLDALGEAGLVRLRGALEVVRLLDGHYPDAIGAVVAAGLVEEEALVFPYQTPYVYRRHDDTFDLALPLR